VPSTSGIDRLSGDTCWIELAFIEEEWTPDQVIEASIQLHLIYLSILNTKKYLETLGVKRLKRPSTIGCKEPSYN